MRQFPPSLFPPIFLLPFFLPRPHLYRLPLLPHILVFWLWLPAAMLCMLRLLSPAAV